MILANLLLFSNLEKILKQFLRMRGLADWRVSCCNFWSPKLKLPFLIVCWKSWEWTFSQLDLSFLSRLKMSSFLKFYWSSYKFFTQHKWQNRTTFFAEYAECHVLFVVMPSIVMLSVIMLNVVMLSVIVPGRRREKLTKK